MPWSPIWGTFDPAVEETMMIREGFSDVALFLSRGSDLEKVSAKDLDKHGLR